MLTSAKSVFCGKMIENQPQKPESQTKSPQNTSITDKLIYIFPPTKEQKCGPHLYFHTF